MTEEEFYTRLDNFNAIFDDKPLVDDLRDNLESYRINRNLTHKELRDLLMIEIEILNLKA